MPKRTPFYEQNKRTDIPESRFVAFNCFPSIASKHRSVHAPDFEGYSLRDNPAAMKKAADKAQIAINANKEYVMKPLTLGNHEFDA